jgi:hypothetical protein
MMNLHELIRAAPDLDLANVEDHQRPVLEMMVRRGKEELPHCDAAALTRWMIPVLLPGLTAEHDRGAAAVERLTPAVTTLLRAEARRENNLKLLENI